MSEVRFLYRYPIKGLSGEACDSLTFQAGLGLPIDRAIAIARQAGTFDPAAPVAVRKDKFLVLMRDAALARLDTHFDADSQQLIIREDGVVRLVVALDTPAGCAALAAFLKAYLNDEVLQPQVVRASGHQFTDISVVSPEKMRAVSIVNLASVRALEAAIGRPLDHRRFRANIYIDGIDPWAEFGWLDRRVAVGPCRLLVSMRTRRCAATEVNPETAERDINVPAELKRHFGHFDLGVYAEVVKGGEVDIGTKVWELSA